MWSLFYTLPAARVKDVQLTSRLLQEQIAASIFPLSMAGSDMRRNFLAKNPEFDQQTACLPAEYAGVIPFMRKAADLLCDVYSDVQENPVFYQINTPAPYASIYDPIICCFQDAIPAMFAHSWRRHSSETASSGRLKTLLPKTLRH